MLRVKSFKIEDDAGVNELVSKYQLASGMHILVSEGYVMIPFEDGTEKPSNLWKIGFQEERNTLMAKVELIKHSQKALEIKNKGIKEQIQTLENELVTIGGIKKAYDDNKPKEAEIKHLKKVLEDNENQTTANKAEITHYMANIEAYTEIIKNLDK